jgi:hypothetical protein
LAIFIELVTDAFEDTFNRAIEDAGKKRRAGAARARRPLRGLEIKDDTYAILKVVQADGSELPLFDSSSENGKSVQYTNFLLQSVTESRMEKHQIVETFGEAYIFFFGEHPRFVDVQAVLINSNDFNWEAEFWENYNLYLRGTKLVEMGARTYLFYDDTIVEGYMLQAQAQKVADQPLSVALSFRLFVTNYSTVSLVGDPNFPIRASVNLPPDVSLTSADAFTAGAAAVEAARAAAMDEMLAEQAALGGAQQASGFGGGDKLSSALRSGLTAATDLTGITTNALVALLGLGIDGAPPESQRTKPLRGLIADNFDEYTALLPPPPKSDGDRTEEDRDGQAEAVDDLPTTLTRHAARRGANLNNPFAHGALGLSARFGVSAGFRATFGASFGASLGASLGGSFGVRTGFGLGVSAGASAGVGFGTQAGVSTGTRFGASFGSGAPPGGPTYVGGVQVGGGLSGGVGIGGGVAGGAGGQGAGVFTGGASFGASAGAGASYAGTGTNASVAVGGTPTCFGITSVPGTLGGTASGFVTVGPEGVTSGGRTTGIFGS